MSLLDNRAVTLRRLRTKLSGGSSILFAALMVGNGLAYVFLMLAARIMTPADYGVLVTLTSISFVLAVFMRTIQAWVVKAVAARPEAGATHIRNLWSNASRVLVPVAFSIFAIHWVASGWVASFLHLESAVPVIVLGLYSSSSLLVPVPRGVLLGLNRLGFAGVVSVVETAARLVAGILLIALGLGVQGALAGYAIGNIVSFAIALVPLWPLLRKDADPSPKSPPIELINRYALSLLIGNACLMIVASLDQIAVKHFFSDQVAGNYAVAFLLGRVIALSCVSFGWVIFARSATLPVNDPRRVRMFLTGVGAIGSMAATLSVGYLILPVLAIRLMGGSQYSGAATYVGLVGVEMTLFALVYVQAFYLMSVKSMQVVWPLCLAVILEILLLARFHDTVQQLLVCLILVMSGLFICVSAMSWSTLREVGRPALTSFRGSPESVAKTA
jgi:O-antigen/teichoic acid export membrane protein